MLGATEMVPWRKAVGRISAEMICPYPPGIPVIAPGELLTDAIIDHLQLQSAEGVMVEGAADESLAEFRVVAPQIRTTNTVLPGSDDHILAGNDCRAREVGGARRLTRGDRIVRWRQSVVRVGLGSQCASSDRPGSPVACSATRAGSRSLRCHVRKSSASRRRLAVTSRPPLAGFTVSCGCCRWGCLGGRRAGWSIHWRR
jgi:Orn/Lys/Arg decarboxylase, C-terminal domain